jgi:hypothetical protein
MSFPNVADGLAGLTQTLRMVRETQVVTDYEVVEPVQQDFYFEGVLEPLKPQRLLLKPEGERNWRYWDMWSEMDMPINTIVLDPEGVRFRVTARVPWFEAGYFQYELTQATTPVVTP